MAAHLRIFALLVLVQCQQQLYQCQEFASMYDIRRLLRLEQLLVTKFRDYFSRQEKNGVTFEPPAAQFIEFADRQNRAANETALKAQDNPILVYRTLARAAHGWNELKTNLSCTGPDCLLLTGEDVFNGVLKKENTAWVTDLDLEAAALAVIRVWTVYDLDIQDLVSGKFKDISTEALSADDVFHIASSAKDAGMLYEAITWFEHMLKHKSRLADHMTFPISTLYRRLATSYHQFGMTEVAVKRLQEYYKKDKGNQGISRDLKHYQSMGTGSRTKTKLSRFQEDEVSSQTNRTKAYEELCRKEGQVSNGGLLCFHRPLTGYYGTARVEEVHARPRILLFHNVLSDSEVQKIVTNTQSLEQDEYFSTSRSSPVTRRADLCEGSTAVPGVLLLSRRLGEVTGSGMTLAQDSLCYQLESHGLGAVYKPTVDYEETRAGELPQSYRRRVPMETQTYATARFQLSDVTMGGATVFPKIQVRIPPVKGSVAQWYNVNSHGFPARATLHVDCPVVLGSSWTATKLITYSPAIANRMCDPVTRRG